MRNTSSQTAGRGLAWICYASGQLCLTAFSCITYTTIKHICSLFPRAIVETTARGGSLCLSAVTNQYFLHAQPICTDNRLLAQRSPCSYTHRHLDRKVVVTLSNITGNANVSPKITVVSVLCVRVGGLFLRVMVACWWRPGRRTSPARKVEGRKLHVR